MIKKLIVFFLLVTLTFCVPVLIKKTIVPFKLSKLLMNTPFNPDLALQFTPEKLAFVQQILAQDFSYFSRGMQTFVFISQDGQYILKFFRKHKWIAPYKKRAGFYLQIQAAKLAYERASDLTGLVYAHLNPSDSLPTVTFKGPGPRVFHLDLNEYRFVIQMKAKPLDVALAEVIQRKDEPGFIRLIRSFLALLDERSSRGIRNTDKKVVENFGFIEARAIEWDFGQFRLDDQLDKEAEKKLFITSLSLYIKLHYPEWSDIYEATVAQ